MRSSTTFKNGHIGYKPWLGKKLYPETINKLSKIRRGKKQSIETRKKRSLHSMGKNSGGWIDGRTKKSMIIRESLDYRLWREAIFKRDNYTCVQCGKHSGNGESVILNADHIKPFAYFPELRFAINNGRTLCIDCHKKTDTYMGRAKKDIHEWVRTHSSYDNKTYA